MQLSTLLFVEPPIGVVPTLKALGFPSLIGKATDALEIFEFKEKFVRTYSIPMIPTIRRLPGLKMAVVEGVVEVAGGSHHSSTC